MVAYRFCRPDDMPLICRAVNACYNAFFPGKPRLTLEALRSEIQEESVWVSNAMVAREGEEPIGVLVGTKRPEEVLIHRIGVRRDYQRRGHGRHMLTSLSQKLAVLGPPRLIAEIPADRRDLLQFFEASSYRREVSFTDFLREEGPRQAIPEGLVFPITLEEVREYGFLEVGSEVAWRRSRATLEGRGAGLEGWGVGAAEQLEAFVLGRSADPPESFFDILYWGCRDADRSALFLGLLSRFVEGQGRGPLRLPRMSEREVSQYDLDALGFRAGRSYLRYAAEATPA